MLLRNISYRYKLPLCMILASALTAVIAVMAVSWQYYADRKSSITEQSQELGKTMLSMLAWSLNHNDVWHAYSLLRGNEENALITPKRTFILIDNQQSVFASNQPVLFPTGANITNLETSSSTFGDALRKVVNSQRAMEIPTDQHILSSIPLISDNFSAGNLIIADSYESLSVLVKRTSAQGLLVISITICILLPLAWYWGKRIVNPLLDLESCISKIGKESLGNIKCLLPNDKDEIGRLSQQFQKMVNSLKKQSELEKQMEKSDRLAAVGAVAAGVAHEINNPLSGMIMALDTYRQYHTSPDSNKRKKAIASIDLVERGLEQIQDIVSALLVNVNPKDKPLTRTDIEDIVKLVLNECDYKSIQLELVNNIHETINIPSTSIRQILMNLLLNAIQATDSEGHINGDIHMDNNRLFITIKNDGQPISEEHIDHLFEPFFSRKENGKGLGMWIVYQIVKNLNGSVSVNNVDNWTVFEVNIPIQQVEELAT